MPVTIVSPEDELMALVAGVPEGHPLKRFVRKLAEYLDGGIGLIQKQYKFGDSDERQKLAGEEEGHEKTKKFLEDLLIRPKEEEEKGDNEEGEE